MKKIYRLLLIFMPAFVLLSGCYAFFQEKIPMDISKDSSSLTELVVPEEKESFLAFPAQVFVSDKVYQDKIVVSWKDVQGATSYQIERAVIDSTKSGEDLELSEEKFEILKEYWPKNTFEDKILSSPTSLSSEYNNIYYYRIKAENISKSLESEFTPFSDGERYLNGGQLFSSPQNVEATKGAAENYIDIKWNPVPNATNYVIYRTEKSNGSQLEEIETIRSDSTSYRNEMIDSERGKEFYYKIQAKNGNSSSALSSIAMGYSLQFGAPSAPNGITVVEPFAKSKSSLTLKWDQVPEPSSEYKRTYSVYRTSSEDNVYTLVKSGIPIAETTITDTSVKPGLIYYYFIQTVDEENSNKSNKIKSAFSEKTDTTFGYLLSAPSDISVKKTDTQDKLLRFKAALGEIEANLPFSYNIYSSDSKDGTYILLQQFTPDAENARDENGYYSVTVSNKPFYKVSTVFEESLEGGESNYSEPVAPVPDAPENVCATKTENLASDSNVSWAPNANGVYPVKITWKKPSQGNTPFAYDVYRSTKPDSGFKKITETPVMADGQDSFYYIDVNDSAVSGIFYFYRIRSLNSLLQGTEQNNPLDDLPTNGGKRDSWGYGAVTPDQWFREYNKTVARSQEKLTLMHKPNDMDKLGSETIKADYTTRNNSAPGTLSYNAAIAGLGAEIKMHYAGDYADDLITCQSQDGEIIIGYKFVITGDTNTSSNMSANGSMNGTVTCTYSTENNLVQGMYPGEAVYNNLQIKGGGAGGGSYGVTTRDLNGNEINKADVDWQVGEEIHK